VSAEANLGAIARAGGAALLRRYPATTPEQIHVLRAMADCRTAALGGHRDRCDRCGYEHNFWNSCRDRHCPGCGAEAREAWLDERRAEVLDVPYFHAVFTIPDGLRALAFAAPAVVYAIVLSAAGHALTDVGLTKLGARLGVLAILHTWTQKLSFHPHVHCLVPGGGISPDGRRWVSLARDDFLLPTEVLSRRFQSLVSRGLRAAQSAGKLPASIVPNANALELLLASVSSKKPWHVYVKPPFGGPEHVLGYLAAYTYRIAISNRRIVGFDGETVTFSYRDAADGDTQKTTSLDAVEFLHRFLFHVVPKRFVRIRAYGFLANRNRHANLDRARRLIGSEYLPAPRPDHPNARLCPQCGIGTMFRRAPVPPQQDRIWFDTS
jgi:putative transposase/transposase-like zinc-binding protein